jgi:hypothetical protein
MKKILIAIIGLLSTMNAVSQAYVNWEWQNQIPVGFYDLVYRSGYIYAVGQYTVPVVTVGANTFTNQGGSDIVIAKFDTLGNVIWANSYGGHGNDRASRLTLDNSGNVYVSGSFNDTLPVGNNTLIPAGNHDILMLKLDNAGTLLLAKQAGGVNYDWVQDIAADNNGNVYMITSGGFTFAGLYSPVNAATVIKFNNAGNESSIKWVTGAAANPSVSYSLNSINYLPYDNTLVFGGVFTDGNITYTGGGVAGNLNNPGPNSQDIFLYKIDTALNQIIKKISAHTQYDTYVLSDMCVGDNGQFYSTSRMGFSLNGYSENRYRRHNADLEISGGKKIIGTEETWTFDGGPERIFYDNNILYGTVYQPMGPSVCTDNYAVQWNIANNTTSYILLNSGLGGVAGHNGKYYLGGWGISKTCNQNCNINMGPLEIAAAPDVQLCANGSVQIGLECSYATGGTQPYSYSWSPVTGLDFATIASPIVSGLPPGSVTNYTLTVTDLNNNVVFDTVTVTVYPAPPQPVIIPQFPSLCDTMYLTTNLGIDGVWIRAEGPIFYPLGIVDTLIITKPGNYQFFDSCYQVGTNTYIPATANVTANATNDTICAGQSVTLFGSGAVSYTWSGGVQNNIPFSPLSSQTYLVTGTDANGCIATSTVKVTVLPAGSSSTTLSICANQTPYFWNGQNIAATGIYTANFATPNGCDSIATLNLTVSPCIVCVPDFTINYSPFYNSLTESQSWIITSGTVLIEAGTNVKLDAHQTSYVTLNPGFKVDSGAVFVAQAYNGCTAGAPQLPQERKIANADLLTNNEIVLYPNPSSGMIHIKHEEKLSNIQIFDMVGKLVINQKCHGETETNINLSHLPNGVYHVKAMGYNSIKVVKND